MESIANKILAEVENYLTDFDVSATAFGLHVMNDPAFVFELRNGRNLTVKTIDKIYSYIADKEKAQ